MTKIILLWNVCKVPLDDALSLYPDVVQKVPMHDPKTYNDRTSIDYRSLITVDTRQAQA